jgi:uncharacterized protein (DUF305 family)
VGFRRHGLLALVAAAAASLASCNGGGSPLAIGGERQTRNASDAAFLRSMTAHEKGALGITRLAQRRALRNELRGIARKMTTEQVNDLRALSRLRQRLPSQGAGPVRPGAAALTRVKDATSFDYEFMRTMIEQNEAAIAIARNELRSGTDPELKSLAGAIASSRQDEIDQLRGWLHLWYGEIQPDPRPPQPAPSPPQPAPSPPPEASPQV